MRNMAALSSPLFAVLQLAAVALMGTIPATSSFADTRVSIDCAMERFSPLGRYGTDTLRGWVTERIQVEISDTNQVRVILASGAQFHGEVKRENSNKIAMEAARASRDNVGRETFITYSLEWFKTNNKLFVDVVPQGYNPMGSARGICKAASQSNSPYKPRSPDSVFGRSPDNIVCDMATENGAWQQQNVRRKWVLEARGRGLTLEDCGKF